ncbi:hypothetical protein BJ508DRAFT_308975 [Ascobolus immersus RN42]|uniref:Uncharacterized protein n=1 Tax=Ascobolus immersus RN42 TaxID=1160509 RepID=A0A3N4I034_ASCIM|nr:hypothetical protein BJ508DRAFT_308975 [Ascobolus immersus RN42]
MTGTYSKADIGMRILIEHLLTLPNITPEDMCIIDADDLLGDPEKVLGYLCDMLDEGFREEMVNWGEIPEELKKQLGKWKGFHEDALEAKGIRKRERNGIREVWKRGSASG